MARAAAEIQADIATVSARIAEILNQQNGGSYGRLYSSAGGSLVVDQFQELAALQKLRTGLLDELATVSAETWSELADPFED